MTEYILQSRCCGTQFADNNWELECPYNEESSLIFANYTKKQLEIKESLPGLYKFADWLPICRVLEGSGAPITYKSEMLAAHLGLNNLYVTFNGYWPERHANMTTGAFKECEAYAVCARINNNTHDKVMVVASAGNTARAFAKVCSANRIPLLLSIPEDALSSMWFDRPLNDCVKLIVTKSGSDYYDAIHLSNLVCQMDGFFPEGGAKNVARRDGMGTTVLSAVTTIGKIPDYYFQAVGSGTGAIAAWEAYRRFLEDGRYGRNKMHLYVSQNAPFTPMYDAWKKRSRALPVVDEAVARDQANQICAKVLSNRKPPYSIKGGLYDALRATDGDVFVATNEEALAAVDLFQRLEGIDIEPAAGVAVASLQQAVREHRVHKDSIIMLNITGGGIGRFQAEHKLVYKQPDFVFDIDAEPAFVHKQVKALFGL